MVVVAVVAVVLVVLAVLLVVLLAVAVEAGLSVVVDVFCGGCRCLALVSCFLSFHFFMVSFFSFFRWDRSNRTCGRGWGGLMGCLKRVG